MRFIKEPSPNHNKLAREKKDIKYVIFHYTGMQSTIASLKRLKSKKSNVSAHYLIDRSGNIYKLVDENKVAWHAGKSRWKNEFNLNKKSIGIELQNKGHKINYQNFTEIQIKCLIKLSKLIKKRYNIKKGNFLGHSDIAPLRKVDPGEKFPWRKLNRKGIGVWYNTKGSNIIPSSKKDQRMLFFSNLKKIGYRYFDLKHKKANEINVIKAFQRKFSPARVNGKIDKNTLKLSMSFK
tara:strand:- start:396 stop:1103 length:708 start_codon:yes stop_codon:yes gene_type:complete